MLLQAVADAVSKNLGYSNSTFAGRGQFKETYRVTDTAGGFLALKLVDRSKINPERTQREIEALQKCSSPHIARVIQVSTHSENGIDYDVVIEEYLDGGNLEARFSSTLMLPDEVLQLAGGIVTALDVLNGHNLVHRDIKPANIMFKTGSGDPVLTDFGLVRDLNQPSLTHSWASRGPGTPLYSAPEQLLNEKLLIDWKSDQFSTGVVMSYALFGFHPYAEPGMSDSDIVDAVAVRKLSKHFQLLAQTDKHAGLVLKMVDPWPVKRFVTPQLLLEAIKNL